MPRSCVTVCVCVLVSVSLVYFLQHLSVILLLRVQSQDHFFALGNFIFFNFFPSDFTVYDEEYSVMLIIRFVYQ